MPNLPTILPASHLRILELLHTYRYLTAEQLLRLGAAKQMSTLRGTLKCLVDTRPSSVGVRR